MSVYLSAFSTILGSYNIPNSVQIYQSKLPPEPKSWKEMLTHPHASQFKLAADKEFTDLLAKKTFEYVDNSSIDQEESPLPLLWVFKYKFDSNGYLVKHKARLCARGDLQTTEEETYAATLATQTFRAVMALVAAFDLETR